MYIDVHQILKPALYRQMYLHVGANYLKAFHHGVQKVLVLNHFPKIWKKIIVTWVDLVLLVRFSKIERGCVR